MRAESNRRSEPDPLMISRADVDCTEAVDLALYVARWMKDYHRGDILDKGDELSLLQVREMALRAVGIEEPSVFAGSPTSGRGDDPRGNEGWVEGSS